LKDTSDGSAFDARRGTFVMRIACRIIAVMVLACLSFGCTATLHSLREYGPGNGKGRVVVIISGVTGPSAYAYVAEDLAEHGYYAVLVDGKDFWNTDDGGEVFLTEVITRAKQSPHALPGKVSVVGFSLGGEYTLSYATRMPNLVSAVVVYYPVTHYIKDPDEFVSKIRVPTLMFVGGRDTFMHCCLIETARKIGDASKRMEGKSMLEIFEYPYAEHAFVIKSRRAWSPTAAADAFRRTLSHLQEYSDK